MSFLDKLLGKAKSWLSSPLPVEMAHDAIVHNRFESALFEEVRQDAPNLDRLIRELNIRYDYTDDLVRDTVLQFYQGYPVLRDRKEMDPGYLANHAVAANITAMPETVETRAFTKHSKYGAAMAAISVGEKIKEILAENKELEQAAKAAAEAQQALAEQNQGVQQAAQDGTAAGDQLTDAMGDFDGNGPLTQEQAEAQAAADAATEALEQALAQAKAAQQAAEQAQDEAEQAADAAHLALRAPVAEGVAEAHEKLSEEAALFRGWGKSETEVAKMDFAQRAQLAQRLRSHDLSKYIKELGRYRVMGQAQRAKRVIPARDEVYDVELSGRLHDMLSSELPMLATEPGRLDFLVRYSEGRLLSKKYRGVEMIGQGAIICCLDTSGSMKTLDKHGLPRDLFAKAMALVMLDQARSEKRDFVGILFSGRIQQRVFHFPKGEADIEQVLEFTETFLGGNTDFERPMGLAIDILEQQFSDEHKAKGDLLLITDDECSVSTSWMKQFQAAKARLGFRVFGMAVGMTRPGSTLAALSDNVRAISEFHNPAIVADLVRAI